MIPIVANPRQSSFTKFRESTSFMFAQLTGSSLLANVTVPNSSSIHLSVTIIPAGCEPKETTVPTNISTYLNIIGYFFLYSSNVLSFSTSSFISSISHIVVIISSLMLIPSDFNALQTSLTAPL